MQKRKLGNNGLEVSALGLGCMGTQAQLNLMQAQMAQMQTALTQSQIGETQAKQRLANSQANNQDLETLKTTAGIALLVGGAAYIADKMGMLPPSTSTTKPSTQTTSYTQPTQGTSAPFETGRSDWHRWHDWETSLTGNQLVGAQYWAGVRSQKPAALCANAPGGNSGEFQEACEAAKKFLTGVDQARNNNADYKAGWNHGAKETGDF